MESVQREAYNPVSRLLRSSWMMMTMVTMVVTVVMMVIMGMMASNLLLGPTTTPSHLVLTPALLGRFNYSTI